MGQLGASQLQLANYKTAAKVFVVLRYSYAEWAPGQLPAVLSVSLVALDNLRPFPNASSHYSAALPRTAPPDTDHLAFSYSQCQLCAV